MRIALRLGSLALGLLTLSILSGCGKTDATVTGTITVGGAPLKSGTISFYPAEGEPINAGIVDGKYTTGPIKPGSYQVSVAARMNPGSEQKMAETPTTLGAGLGPADGKAPPAVAPRSAPKEIQIKYADPSQSGLTFTVKDGVNTYDKDL
jgi:hypothetical protein